MIHKMIYQNQSLDNTFDFFQNNADIQKVQELVAAFEELK